MRNSLENHAKRQHVVIGVIAISMLLAGCGGDAPSVGTGDSVESSAVVVAPECIESAAGRSLGETFTALECLAWTYDDARLWLTHSNATYNCCLDSVSISMVAGQQTITVVETEYLAGGGGCHCLCQYNLDYHVPDVTAGQYTLLLLSDNAHGGGLELLFEIPIDLTSTPTGSYCIEQTDGSN